MPGETLKCIAHVDDDENERLLFQLACQEAGLTHTLRSLDDGRQATKYLSAAARGSDPLAFPLPSLLVMDVKMPELGGLEVLNWIRHHPFLQPLPVLMFSNSCLPVDIMAAYNLGANAFLTKPPNYAGLVTVARFLQTWLELCCPVFGLQPASPASSPQHI